MSFDPLPRNCPRIRQRQRAMVFRKPCYHWCRENEDEGNPKEELIPGRQPAEFPQPAGCKTVIPYPHHCNRSTNDHEWNDWEDVPVRAHVPRTEKNEQEDWNAGEHPILPVS